MDTTTTQDYALFVSLHVFSALTRVPANLALAHYIYSELRAAWSARTAVTRLLLIATSVLVVQQTAVYVWLRMAQWGVPPVVAVIFWKMERVALIVRSTLSRIQSKDAVTDV